MYLERRLHTQVGACQVPEYVCVFITCMCAGMCTLAEGKHIEETFLFQSPVLELMTNITKNAADLI